MISLSQRPLPDNTQHSQQTNTHAPGGIRTHDLSRRAAADLRLRPRGHWDRLVTRTKVYNWSVIFKLQKTSASLLAVHCKVMIRIMIKRRHSHSFNNFEKSLKPQVKVTGTQLAIRSQVWIIVYTLLPRRFAWFFFCSLKPAVKKETTYLFSKQEARSVNEKINVCLAAEKYGQTTWISEISSLTL